MWLLHRWGIIWNVVIYIVFLLNILLTQYIQLYICISWVFSRKWVVIFGQATLDDVLRRDVKESLSLFWTVRKNRVAEMILNSRHFVGKEITQSSWLGVEETEFRDFWYNTHPRCTAIASANLIQNILIKCLMLMFQLFC